MIPKSFVFISIHSYNQKTTPIHSYILPPKKILNSFVYIPIHAYIFQKKSFSNSFVYIPIQSYIFKEQMHLQFIRIYSNSLVYIPKKNTPISFVFFNLFGYIPKKKCCPIHSYVFQFIRVYFQKTIHSGRPHRSCKGNQKRRFKRIGNQTLKKKSRRSKASCCCLNVRGIQP